MTISITIEEYEEASANYIGYCTKCGAERECCEPDAANYPCEECGQNAVQGCDNLLIMGLVK